MSLKASQLSKSVFKVQTDQLGNQSSLLKDIKDNTSSISISANNPSGVKTPLKCDANGQLEISATFSGDSMVIKGEDAAGAPKSILTDAAGHLQVDVLSGAGTVGTEIAGNATPPAETVTRQQVYLGARDVDNGVIRNVTCDGAGTLKCDIHPKFVANVSSAESLFLPRFTVALHDVGNQVTRSMRCDANGDLVVTNSTGATSALQTAGNGSLASIATNTTGLNNCVSGNELQVDIVSGASDATAALQTAGNGSLASIATNTTGLNNCVSGNELQVDIVSGAGDATAANQSTIISNQTDGSQQVKIMSKNDSGANVQVKSDNSGNLAVFAADNFPIFPANTVNGEHGSHSQSFATMLRGRTNITDETSGAFLLCDSAGHLQVDIVSGGGGGDATAANQTTGNTSLSNIDGKLPAALDSGALKVKEQSPLTGFSTETTLSALNGKIITDAGLFSSRFTNEALSGNSSSSNLTIDLGANHGYKTVKYYFSLSGPNVAVASRLHLQISSDGTNWIYLGSAFSVVNVSDNASGSTFAVGNARTDEPPRYIRVYNNDLQTTTINEIYYIAQKH